MNVFSSILAEGVNKVLGDLKRRNVGQTLLTNYFFQPLDRVTNLRLLESEKSLCFLHDEWDFARAYFCTFDPLDLERMLQPVTWPSIVVTDWISREAPAEIDKVLTTLDFHLHTIYDRIVCTNLRSDYSPAQASLINQKDRGALELLLLQVFDKYADHVISSQELSELIDLKQVIVTRSTKGDIVGFVIFRVVAQSCNFNFLYSGGANVDLARLLGAFYSVLTERGIRSGFGWVRRSRPLVLKLHQSFGWKTDGLVDRIYVR